MDNIGGKAALASYIAFVTWRSLNDSSKRHIIQLFDEFAKALAERPKISPQSQAIPREVHPRQIEVGAATRTNKLELDWTAVFDTLKLPANPSVSKTEEPLAEPSRVEPDARWHDVIVPPAVVLIIGKRGSGKSEVDPISWTIKGLC